MNALTKHIDTLTILASLLGALIWMNGKFNDIDRRLVRMETIMIMKGIMPEGLALEANQE